MPTILTINSGSSSLKLGLYHAESSTAEPQLLYRGATDAIGKPGGSLNITDSSGKTLHHESAAHDSQSSAFRHAAQKLREKNCDIVVANDARLGMENDENEVIVLFQDGTTKKIPRAQKKIVARELVRIFENVCEKRLTKKIQ